MKLQAACIEKLMLEVKKSYGAEISLTLTVVTIQLL